MSHPLPGQGGSFLHSLGKGAVLVAFFAVWLAIYKFLNNWGADPIRAIHLTRPVDVWPGVIQPFSAIIYVFAGYLIPLVPFVWNWEWARFRFAIAVYAISSGVAFLSYWLYPLAIRRPPFEGDGVGVWLMRGVVAVDNDANCCPSSHTSFALLAALLVSHAKAPVAAQVATWIVAVAICVTTVTTGQHYAIDVAGGVASALVCYHGMAWVWKLSGR